MFVQTATSKTTRRKTAKTNPNVPDGVDDKHKAIDGVTKKKTDRSLMVAEADPKVAVGVHNAVSVTKKTTNKSGKAAKVDPYVAVRKDNKENAVGITKKTSDKSGKNQQVDLRRKI